MTESIAVLARAPFPPKRGLKFVDLTGRVFGQLNVIGFYDVVNNRSRWRCRCKCGKISIVKASNFHCTQSCGCVRSERGRQMLTNYWRSKRA